MAVRGTSDVSDVLGLGGVRAPIKALDLLPEKRHAGPDCTLIREEPGKLANQNIGRISRSKTVIGLPANRAASQTGTYFTS